MPPLHSSTALETLIGTARHKLEVVLANSEQATLRYFRVFIAAEGNTEEVATSIQKALWQTYRFDPRVRWISVLPSTCNRSTGFDIEVKTNFVFV